MSDFPWLTALILLPLLGAAVVAVLPVLPRASRGSNGALPQQIALGFSLLTALLAFVMAARYDVGGGFQFGEKHVWIEAFGVSYALAVDGLGLSLILLTVVLVPCVILASWREETEHRIENRLGSPSVDAPPAPAAGGRSASARLALVLLLTGLSIGVFAAVDVFLFYVLFEATLIPAYFLIGSFGRGAERGAAAVKFLIYMLLGGLVMLASVVGLYAVSAAAGQPSYLLSDLAALDLDTWTGRWLFLGFFVAFAIKAPLFPVHTWLPDMTGSATPGTSVLLVCILDKIGTFGMLRFCLGLFPEASQWATPVVIALALISIVYGAFLAIGQDDVLRLVGLTSLSHFGLIVLGIFVWNSQGQVGAILYMVNHGLGTAALFLTAGYVVRRTGTTSISAMGGLEKHVPVLAGVFLISGLAALGLPGLSPFVSEFLVLMGAFSYAWWVGAIAVTAIVLAAIYVLWLYQRAMTGPDRVGGGYDRIADLGVREIAAVAPLLVLLVGLGFYPKPLTDLAEPAAEAIMQHVGIDDPTPAVTGESAGSDQNEGDHQ